MAHPTILSSLYPAYTVSGISRLNPLKKLRWTNLLTFRGMNHQSKISYATCTIPFTSKVTIYMIANPIIITFTNPNITIMLIKQYSTIPNFTIFIGGIFTIPKWMVYGIVLTTLDPIIILRNYPKYIPSNIMIPIIYHTRSQQSTIIMIQSYLGFPRQAWQPIS